MLRLPLLTLGLSFAASTGVLADRQYVVKNSCPTTVALFINGEPQGPLAAAGVTIQKTFPNTWSGFIYTDANGGNQNGSGMTRAGFHGDSNYYYIVVDPAYFNVGVRITPLDRVTRGDFCIAASCTDLSCPTAYQQPPTRFPPPTSTPPAAPLFQCPQPDAGYSVECVVVVLQLMNFLSLPAELQIYDCNGTGAQKWQLLSFSTGTRKSGSRERHTAWTRAVVRFLSGSLFLPPASGVRMKIWTCYDNLAAHSWYYTDDNRSSLNNAGTIPARRSMSSPDCRPFVCKRGSVRRTTSTRSGHLPRPE
ncbi:hypothetical protein LshimejAT787_0311770 [Lyophyllum shimeji]|uniref:Uncharacterized protein n=1 Tax=Lyophyllum shimeji TaxID=47721 RepID=A0A9P3PJ49_LYOSH|nr:hypothetical protein LshimejAT787_0311770 [Lyophyllum shimeji]